MSYTHMSEGKKKFQIHIVKDKIDNTASFYNDKQKLFLNLCMERRSS